MIESNVAPLGAEVEALLARVQAQTGVSRVDLVGKLLASQLADLADYSAWLDNIPKDQAALRERGKLLIHCYGPGSLVEDIKAIDPHYRTSAEIMALACGVNHDA